VTTAIITHIDKVRVYLNYDQLLDKHCLEIATNAGTVEFVLSCELLDELATRMRNAQLELQLAQTGQRSEVSHVV